MTEGLRVLLPRAVYALALIGAVGWGFLYLSVSASNGTLGYDYRAYDIAVDRLLAGESMYDPSATSMGAFGLFFYPPPFALLVLPFALLPTDTGITLWTLALVAASLAAVALLPVSRRVRLLVLLLAALSWPLMYSIKLGQVGPILLLLFAIGWRWLDKPWPFGIAAGLGTVIKVQPALLIGWAVVTGRRRAAAIAVATVGILAAIATVVAGPQAWLDEATLLGRASQPVLNEHGFGFARLAYEAGAGETVATVIYLANAGLVVLVTAFAVWRCTTVASYLAVVIASQFLSPVLWDHYALVLLLPTAWLLSRGRWWAVVIPLAFATLLVGLTPPVLYPVAYWTALIAVVVEGIRHPEIHRD
ncbi:MAG: glycosyltransferase family 87 protein [Chloroflexota bacterium]